MQSFTRSCLALLPLSLPQKCIGAMSPVASRFLHTVIQRPADSAVKYPCTLLQPSIPSLVQSCGMKMKGRLRLRCDDCYYVMREGRMYVMCKSKPRHKQMAMKKKEKNTWILSHATQGPRGLLCKHRQW